MQKSPNSRSLAWDAADESEDDDDDGTHGTPEEAWVRGVNGDQWPIPSVPSIEAVSSSWLHEQIVAHSIVYTHASDAENPLLGTSGSGSINKFINARWVHALLDTLRCEDSRLSSPR